MDLHEPLKKEDYQEPRCVLCDPQTGKPQVSNSIPMDRVVQKLDEYCDRKDFAGAERHLKYWLDEAQFNHDLRGAFSLRNEMMGYYRKQGQQEKAIENAQAALELMRELGYEDTPSGGTCYVNCGTVYDQFGMPEQALEFFGRAREIFEAAPHMQPEKLGGLYNNMGLAYMDTGQYSQAHDCYAKALETMSHADHGELESAITLLNMADTLSLEKGLIKAQDEINDYMERAMAFLNTESLPRNGYYAFVAERCAPGFYCYGFDEYGAELEERAKAIREALGAP